MLRVEFVNGTYGRFVCDPARPGSADPIGINELILNVKRSEETAGVVFEITIDLGFILDAKPYVNNCFFNDGGIDALVLVNIREYDPNTRVWELHSTSKVNFNKFNRDDDKITLNFEQRGIQSFVTNGKDLDVNLETTVSADGTALPAQTVLDVPFHSKSILQQAIKETYYTDPDEALFEIDGELSGDVLAGFGGVFTYALDRNTGNSTVAPFEKLLNEIETPIPFSTFFDASVSSDPSPEEIAAWVELGNIAYSFKSAGHCKITVSARAKVKVVSDVGDENSLFIFITSKLIYGRPGNYTIVDIGAANNNSAGPGPITPVGNTVTLDATLLNYEFDALVGDVVMIYGGAVGFGGIAGDVVHVSLFPAASGPFKINLIQLTTFPETVTKGVLLFEAIERTLQYLCNQTVVLKSTLLGRTDIGYDEDGEASLILWTNGNRIRGLNDKSIFASFTELIKFINANWCVSWGVQVIDGVSYVLVEKIGRFYDKADTVLTFGKLFGVEINLNSKLYYRTIKYGYSDSVNIKELNVIDEFNTIRLSELPLQNCKNTLDISTNTKTSGYEIEWLRRLAGTTEDSSNDDKNFAISLIRDGGGYRTKKDEGYDFINGVYEPETGYNYDLSPGRALRNWLQYLSSSLIYAKTKVIKFSSGERNYLMSSKKTAEDFTVFENGNVDAQGVVPIWDTFDLYVPNVPFTRADLKLLRANMYGMVSFKDRFGTTYYGFISPSSTDLDSSSGIVDLKLLKAFIP